MDSTGEVCAQFFKNQKCNFGNFCKHKHIKKDEDRKDTSLVDVKVTLRLAMHIEISR